MTGKRQTVARYIQHIPWPHGQGVSRLGLSVSAAFMLGVVLFFSSSLEAKKKPPIEKAVTGQVVDAAGNPISGATVELTDQSTSKTLALYSDTSGNFRFSGLDRTHDYSLQAKSKGLQSDVRHVSYLDTRDEIVINLTVGAAKD